MEPITITTVVATALGYILKGAASGKAFQKEKEEALTRFWNWARPSFIKAIPDIEETAHQQETEEKVSKTLMELIENDEKFFETLIEKVEGLKKAGVKEKNIFKGSLNGVKKIRIGDKEYSPDEVYDRKNIFTGNVQDADEFILGDGH